jgi:hypothetical protein
LQAYLPHGLPDETHCPAEEKKVGKVVGCFTMKKLIIIQTILTEEAFAGNKTPADWQLKTKKPQNLHRSTAVNFSGFPLSRE